MIINLTLEIDDSQLERFQEDNPQKSREDILGEINNIIYLGGDCINAILNRQLEISLGDYYIEKKKPSKKYNFDDLFMSINDVYTQFDDGKIDPDQTTEIFLNCCNQFIKDHTEVKQ